MDVGPLLTLLSSTDHQILYGRRGTGKTHALKFLAEQRANLGDIPIYVDLRNIGSTGGVYADTSIPLAERGTRLLLDTLTAIHEVLLDNATKPGGQLSIAQMAPVLDKLADAITEVILVGRFEKEEVASTLTTDQSAGSASLSLGTRDSGVSLESSSKRSLSATQHERIKSSGNLVHRVHFGKLGKVLSDISAILGKRRIWILLDEWSVIPIELQPYLADLLRRSVLPQQNITLKIAAIEQRTHFQVSYSRGDYIGIELGADVAADINLDDIMVFDNNAVRAVQFFQELLFKHYSSVLTESDPSDLPNSSPNLIHSAFTQRAVFDEFVRASEGVPRDFINILMTVAQRATTNAISAPDIRNSSLVWFQRDKQAAISSNARAKSLLHWIIDEVIGHRRARAFLLRSGDRHDLIDYLFDARILHVLKRNIAGQDQPGVRFDVYKLDYGCYVDLLTTTRAPQGLLPSDEGGDNKVIGFVDVPPDDYRAIRRAILDLSVFEQAHLAEQSGEIL